MTAKKELLEMLDENKLSLADLEAVEISIAVWSRPHIKANLCAGYSNENLAEFLRLIDVEYDAGYGGQELFGTLWFKDGTWAERGEYDGSEWWEYRTRPEIPKHLCKGANP